MHPFGERTLLTVDMDNEYIDYFAQMHKITREGGSFLRSWDMGMGLNMLGLIAFYTASPLNVILLLFPIGRLTEAVLLLTLVKVGLCGLCFSHFAARVLDQEGWLNLLFSMSYALMGYNMAFSSNVMWLDGVAFLPLVLLGAERILREDRQLGYVLSLVWVFWSSYYIGYMVGGFSLLFFTCRFFSQSNDWRIYLRKLGRFLAGAAVAAGLCAVLLLPAFLNLRSGQDSMFFIPSSFALERSFLDMGAKLLPGVYDSLTDSGLPNLYFGVGGLLAAVLFFFNRRISRRERLLFGALFAFLIVSCSCEFLYLAWHAFEDPTWFPARFSFVIGFLGLFLGLRALTCPQGIGWRAVLCGTGLIVLLFAAVGLRRLEFVLPGQWLLGILLVIAFAALLLAARLERARTPILLAALLLVSAEQHYNVSGIIAGVDNQFGYKTRESYYGYRETYLPAVELTERDHAGVHRIEVLEQRNANGGMALGYHGISHYSTTTDQALNALLKRLGYNTGLINELRFAPNTPLTGGLLGIRYVLARGEMGVGYDLVDTVGGIGLYENRAAFPIAYWAPTELLEIDAQEANPFLLQNDIVAALDGRTAFLLLEPAGERLRNARREEQGDRIVYTRLDRTQPAVVEYEIVNPTGYEAYAFLPVAGRRYARTEAYVDGNPWGRELSYRHNTPIALGAGERVTLRLEIEADEAAVGALYFYALDLETAIGAAEQAQRNALTVTAWSDRRVEGRVVAPESGILATSIPYDSGWTLHVDGTRAVPDRYLDVFLAVELSPGEHHIELRYCPPGFRPGLALTALSSAVLAVWLLRERRSRRRRPRA